MLMPYLSLSFAAGSIKNMAGFPAYAPSKSSCYIEKSMIVLELSGKIFSKRLVKVLGFLS